MSLKRNIGALGLFTCLIFVGQVASADNYKVDATDSSVSFVIENTIGVNSGFVKNFDGQIEIKDSAVSSLNLELDTTTISTFNEKRDKTLQSEKVFDSGKYPKIIFKSKNISNGKVQAEVTIKDVTKTVEFNYQLVGFGTTEAKKRTVLVVVSGVLNRRDFGIDYNANTQSGKPLIGDNLEFMLQLKGVAM